MLQYDSRLAYLGGPYFENIALAGNVSIAVT